MTLQRLIYRSRNAIQVEGARVLIHFNDIVSTARRKNEERGICGFLMFDRKQFYQILEGEAARLDSLFDAIQRDKRHTNVECLDRETIAELTFSDWSMATFFNDRTGHPVAKALGIQSLTDISAADFLRFAQAYVQQDVPS